NARNPVWLNLLGVAIAEIAEELDRLGASADAESLRNDPNLSPTRLWGRSARLAPKSASPLYNLSRFNIWRQQFARAGGYLRNAATLLEDFGGDALFAPSLTFPIWTENVQALDRTLVFHLNERAFEAVSDAERQSKRAALMLWRARELLGDLAHHERKPDEAYAHYHRAADAAPHLATEAMRKSIELGESKGDASWVIASLERLVEANPLDLPHRERLKELYAEEGRSDDELDETVRLLTKAVPNRATFNRAPIERL
ncbi:MAG: hypothetical protein O3A46_12405, partial [Candidatus Poribacteria bacterium]|nr:hypothetical protein [Candidatus Poribacteria bacterium]